METGNSLFGGKNQGDGAYFDWNARVQHHQEFYFQIYVIAAILYIPVIFSIKKVMKAYNVQAINVKSPVNFLFLWNFGLALFSICGSLNFVPALFQDVLDKGFTISICGGHTCSHPLMGRWGWYFFISKIFEFGDTFFIVIRKKPLRLLQYYHHLATYLFTWYCSYYIVPLNSTSSYFTAMNYIVHSFMYTWYSISALGIVTPKWCKMFITIIQSVQMLLGIFVLYINDTQCTGMSRNQTHLNVAYLMYTSYFCLFAHLFVANYINKGTASGESRKKAKAF